MITFLMPIDGRAPESRDDEPEESPRISDSASVVPAASNPSPQLQTSPAVTSPTDTTRTQSSPENSAMRSKQRTIARELNKMRLQVQRMLAVEKRLRSLQEAFESMVSVHDNYIRSL